MTWDDLGTGAREPAQAIADDGFAPDLVLAVARGGLLVAGAIAYALDVRNTFTMNVEFYTGIDERLEAPLLLPPVPDPVDLRRARVLVADDVADTGATPAAASRPPPRPRADGDDARGDRDDAEAQPEADPGASTKACRDHRAH